MSKANISIGELTIEFEGAFAYLFPDGGGVIVGVKVDLDELSSPGSRESYPEISDRLKALAEAGAGASGTLKVRKR